MSKPLEKRKRELDLSRVKLAREEIAFKIEERQEEIQRLQDHMKIQDEKIAELEKELAG